MSTGHLSPKELVDHVIQLGADNPFGVLSAVTLAGLSAEPVTAASALADARRAYMRLAAVLHPDKAPSDPRRATEAFQILVKAFESVADGSAAKRATQAATMTTTSSKPEGPSSSSSAASPPSRGAEGTARAAPKREPKPLRATPTPTVAPTLAAATKSDDEVKTVVSCPNCRLPWQPDIPALYTLLMAFNHKVHCDTCLFQFGAATALHKCPRCNKNHIEYDCGQFVTGCRCPSCKTVYRPKNFPVPQGVLDDIRQQEAAKADREERDRERRQRAAARGDVSATDGDESARADADRLLQLVGECMVNEACPICRRQVLRKAREHVQACLAAPPKAPANNKSQRAKLVAIIDDDPKKRKGAKKASKAGAGKKRSTAVAIKK